jgi:hypothetical protein
LILQQTATDTPIALTEMKSREATQTPLKALAGPLTMRTLFQAQAVARVSYRIKYRTKK